MSTPDEQKNSPATCGVSNWRVGLKAIESHQTLLESQQREINDLRATIVRLESDIGVLRSLGLNLQADKPPAPLIQQIRKIAQAVLPEDTIVLMISKGDSELIRLNGRVGWHFPRSDRGVYAGYYPATSDEAIAHLQQLRAAGADFLLVPSTAFWWFQSYGEFKSYLEVHYRVFIYQVDVCIIYDLRVDSSNDQEPQGNPPPLPPSQNEDSE